MLPSDFKESASQFDEFLAARETPRPGYAPDRQAHPARPPYPQGQQPVPRPPHTTPHPQNPQR